MGHWSFKTLQPVPGKDPELIDLTPEQTSRIPAYTGVLETAVNSRVPNPIFSMYFVKESIGLHGAPKIPAGNIEYGFCQALHGEETAVAALRSRYSEHGVNGETILGIISGVTGLFASPCGNCRDIMLETLGPDLEIVSGASSGGEAIVAKLRDYLFDDFSRGDFSHDLFDVFRWARLAIKEGGPADQ